MLGFFPLYTFRYAYVADHYQYMASIGPIAFVIAAGHFLTNHRGQWLKIFAMMTAGSALVVLSILTWQQCCIYKNERTIWEDTLRKNPQSFMAYNNLGAILYSEGKFDNAISYFDKALQIYPEYAEGCNNLAYALATHPHLRVSDPNKPIRLAKRAIEILKYADSGTLDTLAAAYASAGEFDKAIAIAQKAFDLAATARKKKLADEIETRLKLYKQGKPYRIPADKQKENTRIP
jgi:tetratricopeptide (TPR) repeat protein